MNVPHLEKSIGIDIYATDSKGINGRIRDKSEDFLVEEVLVDGSKASIQSEPTTPVLASSSSVSPYLLCVMIKKDWDTLKAMKAVAYALGISPARIQVGGMKDANAVTAQHITIEGIEPENVRKIRVRDLEIHPIGYVRDEMSSYFLLGNCFHITISAVECSEKILKRRIDELVKKIEYLGGVPNFFGHQRFGTTRPITHLVGKAIVAGRFTDAVMLFLTEPSSYEHPQSAEARRRLRKTGDFETALREFPRQLHYERLILSHLAANRDDFVGAYRRLPFELQMLFVQAFQSFLFNRFLSERLKRGIGLCEAQRGDYFVRVERNGLPLVQTRKEVDDTNQSEINKSLKSGKLRLVIPLVGFKQRLSDGVQGEIERGILCEEDVQPDGFRIKEIPEISSRGSFRIIVSPLNEFGYRVANDINKKGAVLAKVSFLLHKGSYATVVLRELMKSKDPIAAGF